MKKFTLVLFFSIAFYCGKAQINFIGQSRNVLEAFFVGEDIKFISSGNKTNYIMKVVVTDENYNQKQLNLYIDKNSRKCFAVHFIVSDYKQLIKELNNRFGIPVNGYWIAVNELGDKVKITYNKSVYDFWYEYL